MIEIDNLRVNKHGRTICSVNKLEVAPRERVAILGANGSGKTTLLRVLSGLETEYDGRLTVGASLKDRVYVHQSPYLFRGSVMFNVTYGLRQRGATRSECERQGMQWLHRLGIAHLSTSRTTHLSGGETQRVALARAMVMKPRVLLLDEPLANMDDDGAATIIAALDELNESTILVASPTVLVNGMTSRDYQLTGCAASA